VIPVTWRNRRSRISKLRIEELGSRYFSIVAYVWLEKYFSKGGLRENDNRAQLSRVKLEARYFRDLK
jgi:dolichol-phosphate mannosyltransferase